MSMKTLGWNVLVLSFALFVSGKESRQCSSPPAYPHTDLSKKFTQKQRFSLGEKVYYDCAEDLTPSRGSRAVQCLNTGQWSKLSLKCEKRSCGNAGELLNGDFVYKGSSYIGDRVYAVCNDGYKLKGLEYLTCKKSGWTGDRPVCEVEETTCSPPAVAANSVTSGRNVSVYRVGDNVTFTCSRGFKLDGAQQITCGPDGQWQPRSPRCLPSPTQAAPSSDDLPLYEHMEETTCSPPAVAANSVTSGRNVSVYRVGDNVTFTCSRGFKLDGAQQITCGPDGQWQPQSPRCLPSPTQTAPSSDSFQIPSGCGVPPAVHNSNADLADKYITMTAFAPGARVQYVCDIGYAAAGGTRYRTCRNGKWTPFYLKCERKMCGSAGEILNGDFTYTGVEFGDKATAVCDEGYTLVGKATRNCMNDGWDGRIPDCEAMTCEEPPKVANAVMAGLLEEAYTYRSVVSYRCLVGTLIGNRELVCTADGTWSAPPPECKETTCPDPNVPNASWRGPTNYVYQYRETVQIVCNRGFALTGPRVITCGTNNRWLPKLPRCNPRYARRYSYNG